MAWKRAGWLVLGLVVGPVSAARGCDPEPVMVTLTGEQFTARELPVFVTHSPARPRDGERYAEFATCIGTVTADEDGRFGPVAMPLPGWAAGTGCFVIVGYVVKDEFNVTLDGVKEVPIQMHF